MAAATVAWHLIMSALFLTMTEITFLFAASQLRFLAVFVIIILNVKRGKGTYWKARGTKEAEAQHAIKVTDTTP